MFRFFPKNKVTSHQAEILSTTLYTGCQFLWQLYQEKNDPQSHKSTFNKSDSKPIRPPMPLLTK